MNFYVDKIQKFFQSIAKYFSNTGYAFSWLFIIFMGGFALTTLIIIISSSCTYEFVLTRAIDKINKFLTKNPRINDDNLIAFNNKMKERGIPKVLRRQWQQFMLYREHEASYYMSFKHCVENPLKNSTYNQQMGVYRVFSFILAFLSVLLGIFCSYESSFRAILQDVLVIPIFILVLYWLISMVLNLIHNATTGDLYQNYQYFEININKATMTLPEYVDYEVLFTQSEIKKGIPVLFEYIQKRAIEEQQELEKARIKNVEHEKFNFDESGIDASLVLERSMSEAESYIATRKKFMQDIEQVNNEISSLENQYKENVKENQRLMQTSKESLDSLKKQLEQASSSIETNYIKKQMKDEVNRQQSAERDFDAMTDKYNQEQKNLQAEINRLQGEIDKAKKDLESNMMSEFSTYSNKMYKKLEEVVGDDQKEVINGYKKQINELEEKLSMKDQELDNVYSQYQNQVAQMEEKDKAFNNILKEKDDFISSVQEQLEEGKTTKPKTNKFKKKKENNEQSANLDADNSQENIKFDNNVDSLDNFDNNSADNYSFDNDFDQNSNFDPNTNEEFSQDTENNFDNNDNNEFENDNNDFDLDNNESFDFDYQNNDDDNGEEGQTVQPVDDDENDFDYEIDNDAEQRHENQEEDEDSVKQEDNSNDNGFTFNYLPTTKDVKQTETNTTEEPKETADNGFTFDYLPKTEDKKEKPNVDEEKAKEEQSKAENESKAKDKDLDDEFDNWLNDDSSSEEVENNGTDDFDSWLADDEEADNEENIDNTQVADNDEEPDADSKTEDVEFDSFFDDEDNEKQDKVDESKENDEDDSEGNDGAVVVDTLKVKRGPGRPRKKVDKTEVKVKRKPGRPRKVVEQKEEVRRVGRPRKVVENEVIKEKRPVGRPANPNATKRSSRGPGRPRKVGRPKGSRKITRPVGRPKAEPAKTVGRPKTETPKAVGRPKKTAPVGRPRKVNAVGRPKKTNPVGRPRKSTTYKTNLNEIDKKLKELNEQIKRENQNFVNTKKQLERASIKKTKKK